MTSGDSLSKQCWLVVYHEYFSIRCCVHLLTSGAGRTQSEGTFRALTCGLLHWASGRIDSIEVNIHNLCMSTFDHR